MKQKMKIRDKLKDFAVFTGDAVNRGTVKTAIFTGNASNASTGLVTVSAIFAGTAKNVGNVAGDAVFVEGALNQSTGTIGGTAYFTTPGNNLNNEVIPANYTQQDGFQSYGYFVNSVRVAPQDFNVRVYAVNNVWYKYDNTGSGALANGMFK